MRNLLIVALIGIAASVVSQNSLPSTSPTTGPRWEQGSVDGKTYKNSSIGIELIPAPELQLGAPVLKGKPGTVPLLVTITAAAQPTPGVPRPVMAFYADALGYYPENRRSTEAYMGRVALDNQRQGLLAVGESGTEQRFGGVAFLRTDFKKGAVYEAVLVRACKPQALVFIFTGSGRDPVDKLISATQFKLNLATSGCGT